MRLSPIFAAILAFTGIAVATPAAAATATTRPASPAASLNIDPAAGTTADQYRDRRWRDDRGNRGWRGDRGWRGNRGYYRRGYYRPYRSWNRGRVVCRYRYGHRRCFRVY